MKVITLLFVFLVLASGCASTQPTPEQLASADYGTYPENYQTVIKDFMSFALKDPESARYQFKEPYKGYKTRGLLFGGGVEKYGWLVEAYINAKNSFGGYVGSKKYTFLFRGDDFDVISVDP
jgi:hypothetical protein